MKCHNLAEDLNLPAEARRIVLAGNPNVGKSVFFNAFSGIYVDVSNYPGTTLEILHGRFGNDIVLDTPGVYGVSSFNQEEIIARDVILSADMVVNVVNAVSLERDLFLTLQLIDMGLPVIVALNMMDEAAKHGVNIDLSLLSDLLGVPVIPTVATAGKGLKEIKQSLDQARPGHGDPELNQDVQRLLPRVRNRGEALLILEGDEAVSGKYGLPPGGKQEEIYLRRRGRINEIVCRVARESSKGASFGTRLGRWMIRPATGIPILAGALWIMYQFIGVLIAQTVVGFTEGTVMQGMYQPLIQQLVERLIPAATPAGQLLIGEFGVLTMTVTYILGLLLPLVLGFYLILSVMEDSGYLPRIATLVDRVLNTIGLNGRGVIPIILGFGCVTMATITTRLLGSDRERRIATFLLAMAIPCSAQLAVIVGLLAGIGPRIVALYVAIVFTILVVMGTLLNRFLPGESSDLLIDLPPLRWPRLKNVAHKTASKSTMFIKEATPLFAGGALLIGILQVTGLLVILQDLLAPLTVGWLQLPKEAARAFIMGFVRRDFGAAGLYTLQLTDLQKLVSLVTITIFVPCIASVMVIFKERGRKEALIMWSTIMMLAFLIGGIISQIVI